MRSFASHVFKFIHFKLNESPLLGDVALLVARELDLGPVEGLSHVLLVLQLGLDGPNDLSNVNPGHCVLGLSKIAAHTSGAWIGDSMPVMNVHWTLSIYLQGPLGQPVWAIGCVHY